MLDIKLIQSRELPTPRDFNCFLSINTISTQLHWSEGALDKLWRVLDGVLVGVHASPARVIRTGESENDFGKTAAPLHVYL